MSCRELTRGSAIGLQWYREHDWQVNQAASDDCNTCFVCDCGEVKYLGCGGR